MISRGHTTAEYAICLGLMGVLTLGSVKLLGGNISGLLQSPTSGPASSATSQLFGLIDANAGIMPKSQTKPGSTTTATMQLQVDPSTGQVVTSTTTGGSTNTTSVPGDQAMSLLAQQIGLLTNVTLSNGQPIPNEIQQQILKLMQDGVSLSGSYNTSLGLMGQFNAINAANAGKTGGLEMYPSTVTLTLASNLNQSVQFQQDYNKLNGMLSSLSATDPTVTASLIQPINQLAGGISGIQYDNVGKAFVTNLNPDAIPPSDIIKAYTQNAALQQTVPPSTIMGAMSLPPDQAGAAVQGLITTTAQNAVVGTQPTAGSPISLNVAIPNSVNPTSGTISGASSSGSGTTTSNIKITNTGVQAGSTTTP